MNAHLKNPDATGKCIDLKNTKFWSNFYSKLITLNNDLYSKQHLMVPYKNIFKNDKGNIFYQSVLQYNDFDWFIDEYTGLSVLVRNR